MPPRLVKNARSTINPAPRTAAAKQALKAFFCDLCQKGYSRMDEYETHISSYEHQHKKRYNELRQMQKDSTMTADQRREREMREAGMRSISLTTIQNSTSKVSTGANSTASRPGFKSIGGGGGFKKLTAKSTTSAGSAMQKSVAAPDDSDSESELDYVRYDPRQPTSP
ncbi:putative g patch domain-containing protein 8 [Kockiozyma suomiensis]|uniref:putative g patch domain-containing protein 8 n=1 Tax=Kockiozyma suomiensis TaxID=1337062 RepID=UPI0033434865